MRRILTTLFCIIFYTLPGFGQNISGIVLDAESNELLPFVNIAWVKGDSIYAVTTTDFDGKFSMSAKGYDEYTLRFVFTGYKPYQRIISVTDELDISLGKVLLESNITELEGVTVTAERENVNMTANGMSFNVDDDGGTDMEDIISGMPSVTIDENGEVTSNGETVVILVNGEESDLENPLEEIPMQMIDRVELLNNPPAEYTSASSAINIILKENVKLGNHARVQIQGGIPEQYKGNVNVSRSNDRWATTLNLSYQNIETPTSRESSRLNYDKNYREAVRDDVTKQTNYNVNWITSYALSANDKLKLLLTWQQREHELQGDEVEYLENTDVDNLNPRINYRSIYNDRTTHKLQAQLNYDKHFMQEGRKLLFRARWSMDSFDQYNSNGTNTYNVDKDSWSYNDTRITERERPAQNYFASLKYIHPFNERSTLTTGFRNYTKVQKTNEKYYNITSEGDQEERGRGSQNTDYLNQKFSGYASWNYKFYNDVSFNVGAVVENSIVTSEVAAPDTLFDTNNSFLVINPNASLNKKFNENWMGNISYSFRMNTPSEYKMNPLVNDNNPLFISFGNPNLGLEKFQKLSLNVTNQQDKVSTRLGLFYRNIMDGVERVYQTKGDTIISTFDNVVDKHTIGTSMYIHWHVAKNQSIILSGNLYQDIYNQRVDERLPLSAWVYNAKMTYKAKFFTHYRFRIVGYYVSQKIEYNGNLVPASGVDVNVSRYVAKRKGKIWVSAQDIFQTRRYYRETYSPQFESEYDLDLPSQVRLGFSWSFYSI
ncbi:outer membrane beta-barrel protein [Flammeovirga agarivorans]|uniref:TonB-dependent receptor n=1 Tax=Flammeovirga agarivorans TaxID=2726742 RepID=A0A7X8SL01_9BACT|nr:outer membrane beta-barrel protein [Flammeovirga agarivorans]NLR92166.1 TonB-dependent receptor [Flammeovirga agarivorans]